MRPARGREEQISFAERRPRAVAHEHAGTLQPGFGPSIATFGRGYFESYLDTLGIEAYRIVTQIG